MQKIKTRSQVFVITVILGLTIFGLGSLPYASAASFNNVQIFIQTESSLPDYFMVSAYNMSGFMVASSQSYYPAASFELPNGQYIFTVTAQQQYYYSTPYSATPVKAEYSNSSGTITSIVAQAPVVEYGYSTIQVASSTSITISTMDVTSPDTNKLAIKVTYANGTAAEGASVYASILGGNYWGYENNVVMSNVTDADGVSTLIVPQAPVQVYAWSWLPLNVPNGPSTVQVTVGGEKVNITVYWQPTSVGLAGSTIIVPPEAGASISLRVQQSDYWVMSNGVKGMGTTTAGMGMGVRTTTATEAGSIPAAVYQQSQGSLQGQTSSVVLPTTITSTVTYSNPGTTSSTNSGSESSNSLPTGSELLVMIVAVLALALAVLSILFVARIRKQQQAP